MGAKIQAFDIFRTPLSSHYPLPLIGPLGDRKFRFELYLFQCQLWAASVLVDKKKAAAKLDNCCTEQALLGTENQESWVPLTKSRDFGRSAENVHMRAMYCSWLDALLKFLFLHVMHL